MVFLFALNLFDLLSNGSLVGRSLHVADNAESNRETMLIVHHGKLQLQGVVLAVGIMNKDILLRYAVLANLHHLQAEALLNKTILVVLAEDERLAVFHVDGILLSSLTLVDRVVGSVVEDYAVLQNLANRSSLVLLCSLQNLHCAGSVGCHGTGKEMSSRSEA